jgi:predicted dehydrogenase
MLKIAQIGVGYWGPNLLRNLAASPRCSVETVVDLSAERRGFVGKHYPGVVTTADAEEVFADPGIAAVVVSTPVATHFDLVCRALNAGKHVLVEKPMARSVSEIDEIERLSNERGLVAMVGHTFLFNSAVRYLKELLVTGQLGEIRYIYSQRLNLGRIRSDVDALWNLAPHDVSIIQYLLGDPEPVGMRRTGMDFIQKGIDDVVFLDIEYPGKILAHVHVSWLDPHKVRSLTVVGSKKMAIYDDVAENKIAIYDKGIEPKAVLGERMDYDAGMAPVFVHRSGDVNLPAVSWNEPLKTEIEHFFDCIEGKANCITGPSHARRVIAILEGARR